jgi:hypothetical protein
MKKFLFFISGLLIAFILANYSFLALLPLVDWDFGKTKEAYQFKNQSIKVLVIGNSAAMDGINTEILTTKVGNAYNFSVGGASLQTNYIQLKNYLQQNQKPQKVLLFLTSAHYSYSTNTQVNPIVDYYYNDIATTPTLKDIPLFKFRWLFLENIKKILSKNHRNAKVLRGQLSINSVVPDNTNYSTAKDSCLQINKYNTAGYDYMWQIASLCKQNSIALEVYEMPCWKAYQNNCADTLITNSTTNNSIFIKNLNDAVLCNNTLNSNTDWLSKNHLNRSGAIKVTNLLITKLNK